MSVPSPEEPESTEEPAHTTDTEDEPVAPETDEAMVIDEENPF